MTKILSIRTFLVVVATFNCFQSAWAQSLTVQGAWARATVQGQKATGVFMTLISSEDCKLTTVSSPVAGYAEVHEMVLEGDVMKMRPVSSIGIATGKEVVLKPGGYHIMLMDLKMPLKRDTTIPLVLTTKGSKGAEAKTEVRVPVLLSAPGGNSEHTH